MLFFWTFYLKILNVYHFFPQIYLLLYWVTNIYISMISEESCHTEDWGSGADISAVLMGIHYIVKCYYRKSLFKILILLFYCIFYQKKINLSDLKNLLNPNDWTVEQMHTLCTLK